MVKVSIIVCVYNGEKYLKRCMDSLINQTLAGGGIEIVVVDNASTDNTAIIIDTYKNNYPNLIRFIHNRRNLTLGTSRNIGVSNAIGAYIGFVDADDWVENDFYEKMYNAAITKNADIVLCGVNRVYEDGTKELFYMPSQSWNMDLTFEKKKEVICSGSTCWWNTLTKRSVWKSNNFKNIENCNLGEDYASMLFSLISERMAIVSETLYNYYYNINGYNGGGMYGDEKRCAQNIEALGRFLNKAKELNIYEKYKDEFEYYCFKETVMQCMNIVSDKNRYLEVSQETWNLMFSFLRKEFPNYLENKYLNSMFERRTVCRIRLLEKGKKSVEKFQMKEDEIVYNKTKELLLKYTDKVVGIWGAGQKGKAFLQKYDRDNKQIKYVVDSNPELWGTYMETGHLITGIEKIKGQVDVILCMNFRYFDEMQEDLVTANMDKKVNLIDYERYIYDDWED